MKKTTVMAVGVFALLLVAVVATREENVNVGVPKLSVAKVDPAQVTELELSGAISAKLVKDGEVWKVSRPDKPDAQYAADDAQVQSALRALSEFRAGDFVSEKRERHAELEVDDAKGLRVEVRRKDGAPLSLVFGKSASGGGTYVREPGKDPVWVTTSYVASLLRREVNGWRKRAFISHKAEDLAKLSVTHADGSGFTAERKDGAWTLTQPSPLPSGFRFDPSTVDAVARQLAGLSAQEFADPTASLESFGLTGTTARIEATTKDGRPLNVRFGTPPKDGASATAAGTVPVKVDGDSQVYLVAKWSADSVLKRVDDLRDLSLLSFDQSRAQRLSITASGKKVVVERTAGAWKLVEPKKTPDGFEFDEAQVYSQLSTLRTLKAARVATDQRPGKPEVVVEIAVEGGAPQRLELANEVTSPTGAKQILARGSVDGLTYAVDPWLKTRLSSGVELFKKPAPPPSFGSGSGLDQLPPDVRAKLEAQLRARP